MSNATTTTREEEIKAKIAKLSADEAVETNEGTYGNADAHRAIGTGDPRFANYTIYERLNGSRYTIGCDPERAPGRARHLTYVPAAERRSAIAELRKSIKTM